MQLKVISSLPESQQVKGEDIVSIFWNNGQIFTAINTSDNRGLIKVWNENLNLIHESKSHEYPIYHMTPGQGSDFYTACTDAFIRHWEYRDEEIIALSTLTGHSEPPNRLLFTGNRLYSGDSLGEVRIWENGEQIGCLGTVEEISDMLIENDILFHTRYNDVYLTSFKFREDGRISWSIKNTIPGRGPLLITGNKLCLQSRSTYEVLVHDLSAPRNPLIATLKGHDAIISSYVGDSKILYSADFSGKVIAWDLENYQPISEIKLQGCINDMTFDPDKGVVYAAGENRFVSALKLQ